MKKTKNLRVRTALLSTALLAGAALAPAPARATEGFVGPGNVVAYSTAPPVADSTILLRTDIDTSGFACANDGEFYWPAYKETWPGYLAQWYRDVTATVLTAIASGLQIVVYGMDEDASQQSLCLDGATLATMIEIQAPAE